MLNPKSMRISQLVKELNKLEQEFGDVPVYLSKDPEGNGYGTLDILFSFGAFDRQGIILYPTHEFFNFE